MKSKKEELRKFKLSWKLLEELPDAIKEEEKHWGLFTGPRSPKSGQERMSSCHPLSLH